MLPHELEGDIIVNKDHQDANYLFLVSSTCFGRYIRPSSGARDCIYCFWQCPPMLLPAGVMDETELSSIASVAPAGSNIGGH